MSDRAITGGLVRSGTVAALYIDPNGVYSGLPDFEVAANDSLAGDGLQMIESALRDEA